MSPKKRWTSQWTPSPLEGRAKSRRKEIVDEDRTAGSAKEIKGAVKEAVGKAVGDAKLEADGKADKIEGKVQNAIGGLKDTLRGK
jgi:uncharacterized protein YjbJ (UPF0337 family)